MKKMILVSLSSVMIVLAAHGALGEDDDFVVVGEDDGPIHGAPQNDRFGLPSFKLPNPQNRGSADDAYVIDSDTSHPGFGGDFHISSSDPNKAGFRTPKRNAELDDFGDNDDEDFDDADVVVIDASLCLAKPKDSGDRSRFVMKETMFSYVLDKNACEPFSYFGRGGSSNRFATEDECMDRCKNTVEEGCFNPPPDTQCAPDMDCVPSMGTAQPCHTCCCIEKGFRREFCQLPLEDGSQMGTFARLLTSASCRANLERWYFDSDRQECVRFAWGGCNRNENHFPCKEMCEAQCLN